MHSTCQHRVHAQLRCHAMEFFEAGDLRLSERQELHVRERWPAPERQPLVDHTERHVAASDANSVRASESADSRRSISRSARDASSR